MTQKVAKSLNGNQKGRREQLEVLIGRVNKDRCDERSIKRLHVIRNALPEASVEQLRGFKAEVKEIVDGQQVIKSFSKAKMRETKGVEELA